MSDLGTPRPWAHVLVAGLTTAGLLVLPPASPAGSAPAPTAVRLAPEGDGLRSPDVDLADGTTRLRTSAYSMVAATWRGPAPQVSIRPDGGEWEQLPVLHDGPDGTERAAATARRGTDLVWTGEQRGLEVRVRDRGARDVELVLLDPTEVASDEAAATKGSRTSARSAAERAPRPELRTRREWGANNAWRNGRPRYLDKLKQVHLHHTATSNDYRRRDVPGIIRGMYRYHTKSLGWFDIGYNFLVDKYGRSWIGRSGGAHRLVQGAHTLGFNHASVGVAVIGNYESTRPRKDVIRSLKRLAAWKFDRHDRDARRRVFVRSTGSDRYRDGKRARLPAFDGHRDTNDTACPGELLYERLPALRRLTQRRINHFA